MQSLNVKRVRENRLRSNFRTDLLPLRNFCSSVIEFWAKTRPETGLSRSPGTQLSPLDRFFVPRLVNRGDSFRRRRSRSNSLAPADPESEEKNAVPAKEITSYTVAILGARGVGKTALISQFMTSDCINAYDRQRADLPREDEQKTEIRARHGDLHPFFGVSVGLTRVQWLVLWLGYLFAIWLLAWHRFSKIVFRKTVPITRSHHVEVATHRDPTYALVAQPTGATCIKDIPSEQSVFVMLNGEESELRFLNIANPKTELENIHPDAFVIMYSVIDKASFQRAEEYLERLHDQDFLRGKSAILVGNKVDLVRSRVVSSQDGKCMACTYRVKFIEVSVGINHNVDDLLVGILNQIRLKNVQGNAENRAGNGASEGSGHWYKSRGVVRASMKARQMLTWLFGKEDSKFKNCENLHVL
ncbi:GTP-binding protein RAD [Eufriesea mexicana]|uniref:GTP-binding protein RAD n=1 Tax=Eufriesea mexicana TaxID=516756 RepID=A0A310SB60_9HYME|nr:GTP-binding protein RAD [Eufriesea mexicana]